MLALGLCIALFLYWTAVGYATVAPLHAGRTPLRNLLIAPTVGVIVSALPLFTLNRLGLPVKSFGPFVPPVLLGAAGLVLWRLWKKDPLRVALPWPKAAAFAGVVALALYLTARPMLEYGFEWLSFCNDDMANYCLAAERNYSQGFFDFPPSEHLLQGRYYPSDSYFLYAGVGVRPGSELTLAGVMSLSGRNAHEVFMPTVLALHLALVWATGALLLRLGAPWRGRPTHLAADEAAPPSPARDAAALPAEADPEAREYKGGAGDDGFLPALLVCVLVAASALLNLGVLYQLIAQTVGLAVVAVLAGLLMRPFEGVTVRRMVAHGMLVAVVGAGLLLFYPELGPFIGLPFFLYTAVGLLRRRIRLATPLVLMGVGAAGALLVLGKYAVMTFVFLRVQATIATGQLYGLDPNETRFPYFMVPKGLCDLWGVLPVAGWTAEPALSIAIAAGGLLLLAAAAAAMWGTWRGRPEGAVLLVMLAIGALIFRQRMGFALFKLAMYLQPFALATLAAAWFGLARPRRLRADVGLAVAALGLAAYLMVTHGRSALRETTLGQPPGKALVDEFPWVGLLVFVLPLLLGALVAAVVGFKRKRSGDGSVAGTPRLPWAAVAVAPLLAMGYVGLTGQRLYLRASTGDAPQFLEIPNASATRVNDEFEAIVASSPHPMIVSDTFNMVLGKFQALYARGRVLSFPSGRFFSQLENEQALRPLFYSKGEAEQAFALRETMWDFLREPKFDLKDPAKPGATNLFHLYDLGLLKPPGVRGDVAEEDRVQVTADPDRTLFVQAVGRHSVLNRHHHPPEAQQRNFKSATLSGVRNQLIFVQSELGRPYFLPGKSGSAIALYQVEDEPRQTPFFDGGSFAATGRYLLFQAVNPSPKVRLLLSYTCSYNADGDAGLPPAAVIGGRRVPLPIAGRGCAHVFSEPLEPQQIAGRQFLMLDMGAFGKRLPVERTGLMNLFGTDVAIDARDIVGRARDVSIVSDEEYQNLRPPSRLNRFSSRERDHPLRDPNLEYSGWYENDGWMSEEAYCRLTQPPGEQVVAVRGVVPGIVPGFRTSVSLLLDGVEVARSEVVPEKDGRFELVAPATTEPGKREVRVRFSNYQRLPIPDNRPAGGRITSIGFEPANGASGRGPRSRPTTQP